MKKLFALLLVVTMLSSTVVGVVGATEFSDVSSQDWFYDNVWELVNNSNEIIKGYPDGTFRPKSKLTKDQFITMVVRAVGYNLENSENYWAQNNIDKAIELGLVYIGEFDTYTSEITREEMSRIIVRVILQLDGSLGFNDLEEVNDVVIDSADISTEFISDVQKTYKLGIITGYPDFTFKPQGVLTRSEASAVIVRVIDESKRIEFDYDTLYDELHGSDLEAYDESGNPIVIEDHLYGGSLWVDPTSVDHETNAREDWDIIQSDMRFTPNELSVEMELYNDESVDAIDGAIVYNESSAEPGQKEDFINLLNRRLEADESQIVMDYLNKKNSWKKALDHEETFLVFETYVIRLKATPHPIVTDGASVVEWNMWFRDDNFLINYEENKLQFYPHEDVVINYY